MKPTPTARVASASSFRGLLSSGRGGLGPWCPWRVKGSRVRSLGARLNCGKELLGAGLSEHELIKGPRVGRRLAGRVPCSAPGAPCLHRWSSPGRVRPQVSALKAAGAGGWAAAASPRSLSPPRSPAAPAMPHSYHRWQQPQRPRSGPAAPLCCSLAQSSSERLQQPLLTAEAQDRPS